MNYKPELLHRPRSPRIFEAHEKLLIQRITGGSSPLNATYDDQQFYNKESINNLLLKKGTKYNIKFILGLINSKLINWMYLKEFTNESHLTVNLSKEYLSQIPVRNINFSDKNDLSGHDEIVSLVDRILDAKRKDPYADTSELEREIDRRVYQLYDLTPDEIEIVEASTRG